MIFLYFMLKAEKPDFFRSLSWAAAVLFLAFYYGSVFSQPRTVDDYLVAARRYNASLVDYQNQLASLTYDSSKIRASYLPKVNFNSLAMIAPTIGGFGYDGAITNGGNYSALVAASQDLLQGGNRDLQLAKLNNQRQSIATTLILSERDLVKNITSQYVAVYSDLSAAQAAEANVKLLDEQVLLLKGFVSKGVYSQSDYLNLLIARNQQEIALLQARTQYRTDLYKLNLLAGISDSTTVILSDPQLGSSPAIPLYQSLRVRQFTLDSLSIEYDRSLLDWTYRPKFGWFADAGLNTSDLKNAYHNLGFSVGLNFSIPIYDGGQRNFEYEKFNLAHNTIAARSRVFFIETNIQRNMLADQLQAQDSLIVQYRKQLESINELIQFQKLQLKQGNLKINDLLLTFNLLNNARSSMRQTVILRSQTIIELNYLNQ